MVEQMDTAAAVEFEEFLSRSVCQLATSAGAPTEFLCRCGGFRTG